MVKSSDGNVALQTIFELALKQQAVSEQTNRLVQSMLDDVRGAQQIGEKIAILINRVETIERSHNECIVSITGQLRDLELKREQNKDRIAKLEQDLTCQMMDSRTEFTREIKRLDEGLRNRLDESVNPMEKIIAELREKIAYSAGKYGAGVALIISLLMMLLQYILTHPISTPKP
jgi:hypothetical protein